MFQPWKVEVQNVQTLAQEYVCVVSVWWHHSLTFRRQIGLTVQDHNATHMPRQHPCSNETTEAGADDNGRTVFAVQRLVRHQLQDFGDDKAQLAHKHGQ